MGDANPICTLGDYSKPSHEGYRNTIELPVGNNVVPLQSDTIRLVQNGCSFYGLWFEDPNQHLMDFLKLVDSLDLDGENRERAHLLPHHGIDLWLLIHIFYDRVDYTTQMGIDYAAGERLRKLRPDEAWATIEKLSQYEDEGWNDAVIPDEEERVKQLEEYMKVIIGDFMQLSSEVIRRLKDKIREEGGRLGKIEKITKYPDMELGALEVNPLPPKEYQLRKKFECSEYSRVVCTKCATMLLLGFTFTLGTSSTRISSPAKVLLKPSSSPLTKTLSPAPNRYDYNHLGVRFRLRGEKKEISFLELGWRIGLYSQRQSRESATLSGLRKGVTVKANHFLLGFWTTIRDDRFNVGNTKVAAIRDPRVKLAYRCITMSITGRKESTHSVTEIDLFYLYCIYSNEVVCNIPYWLAKYMVGIREKSLICEGMFVTWISRSYGLLTKEIMGALSVEPSPHVFKKKSLNSMGVIMELHNRGCFWPTTLETVEEDEAVIRGDESTGGDACHKRGWRFCRHVPQHEPR
ncbi:hypothetical protein Tco_0816147 [Tanacetum coccineum]